MQAWLASPLRQRCLRVLLELPDGPDERETHAEADGLLAMLNRGEGPAVPVLLHGRA